MLCYSINSTPLLTEYDDYVPLINKTLTFTPGVVEQCANITLMGDDAVEGQEMFSVKMTSPVSAVNVDSDLVITLLDNDGINYYYNIIIIFDT